MSFTANLPVQGGVLPVAVDTAGGDKGPEVQVEGCINAYNEFGISSILVGRENDLRQIITKFGFSGKLEIRDAPEVITMSEAPAMAVRRKPNSSLCVAYELLLNNHASSVLSSGNSGAMMVAGNMLCGTLPGIERPAIASLIPKVGELLPNVVLDSGANVECHASNLVQFALMGSIYFSSLFNVSNPKVGLLSNGSEPSKGTDVIRAAAFILSQIPNINYIGYVEGRDVATELVDVVVCDGLVGNVLLKAMEGCVKLIGDQIALEAQKSFWRRLGLSIARSAMKDVFYEKFDYTAYGGAPLLGLTKLALVLHGSSDSRAVKNGVRVANDFAKSAMTEKISLALAQLEEFMPALNEGILTGVFSKKQKDLALKKSQLAQQEGEA